MLKRDLKAVQRRILIVLLAIAMLFSLVVIIPREVSAAEDSRWVQMGSIESNERPMSSSILFHEGTPYLLFRAGDDYEAEVHEYTDAGWTRFFTTADDHPPALRASLVVTDSGKFYLAYAEEIYSEKFSLAIYETSVYGTEWRDFRTIPVDDGTRWLSIDSYGETLYMAFIKDGQLQVKADATAELSLGSVGEVYSGSQVDCASRFFLTIDQSDGTPYVVYADKTYNGLATVKRYDGENWVTVGEAGFSEKDFIGSNNPFIVDNGMCYLSYIRSDRIYVEKYENDSWENIGASLLDSNGNGASLVVDNDMLYMANSSCIVQKFDGTLWEEVDGTRSDSLPYALEPTLVIDKGILYLSYVDAHTDEMIVKRLNTQPTDILLDHESAMENMPIGTVVGNLSVEDPDAFESHEYTLVSGEGDQDNVSFTIQGDQLKTAAVFDYEIKDTYSIRIAVEDGGGQTYEKTFTILIEDEVGDANDILVDLGMVPQGYYNQSYSYTPTIVKGSPPYTWNASGLPEGLNISSDTGEISGIPTKVGIYEVTLIVSDDLNVTVQHEIEITIIYDDLSILSTTLPNATLGEAYSCTLSAKGGNYDYKWFADGLPQGLRLEKNSGQITGKPLETGTFDVTFVLCDGENNHHMAAYTLTVSEQSKVGKYTITPNTDAAYKVGTKNGYKIMTVKNGITGFQYFNVTVSPSVTHEGEEVVVFVQMCGNTQIGLSYVKADFDLVSNAGAAFNVKPGDVIKVYIVDELNNSAGNNPILLQ